MFKAFKADIVTSLGGSEFEMFIKADSEDQAYTDVHAVFSPVFISGYYIYDFQELTELPRLKEDTILFKAASGSEYIIFKEKDYRGHPL